MKLKTLLLLGACCLLSLKSRAQLQTPSDGYKLKWVQNYVKVYLSTSNAPNMAHYKMWNHKRWFYTGETVTSGNVKYVRLFIPNKSDVSGVKESATSWTTDLAEISSVDYDTWLFVTEDDFNTLKQDHFPKLTSGLVIAALTVPFKIHPALGSHSSSLYNSSFNAGTFIGGRLGFLNDIMGISLGGMFGIASLDQNSSVNTAIPVSTSQAMTAINYGGGLIFDLSHKFELGTVVGWDHGYGDLNKTYIYQNKAWFALSLNFKFLDSSKTETSQ